MRDPILGKIVNPNPIIGDVNIPVSEVQAVQCAECGQLFVVGFSHWCYQKTTHAFMVTRIDGSGKSPSVRHETLDKARKEADRLASTHPNVKFAVVQVIEVKRAKVTTTIETVSLTDGQNQKD